MSQPRQSDVFVATIEKLEQEVKRLREVVWFARDFGLAAMIKSAIGESEE